MENILTVMECLEDIRKAQKELERAHYHLRIAIELSMLHRERNEKERNKRDFECNDLEAHRREKGFEELHFSEA